MIATDKLLQPMRASVSTPEGEVPSIPSRSTALWHHKTRIVSEITPERPPQNSLTKHQIATRNPLASDRRRRAHEPRELGGTERPARRTDGGHMAKTPKLPTWDTAMHEVGDGCFAYVQATGGLNISNAGLIVGPDHAIAVDAQSTRLKPASSGTSRASVKAGCSQVALWDHKTPIGSRLGRRSVPTPRR